MNELEEIKGRLAQLESKQTADELAAWKMLLELQTEVIVLSEVVQSLAAQEPNLNPVMERLLARKDELLARSSPEGAKMHAAILERWHTSLLYIQRVEKAGGA